MTRWVILITFSIIFVQVQLLPYDNTKPAANDDLVVQLLNPSSKISGHILQSNNGTDFYAFQEIPFAAPPTGENRLKPPQPVISWDGILNTTQNTKACVQGTFGPPHDAGNIVFTEDCLYLNVYTPVKPGSDASLPVYVWIYGGGYMGGEASIYSYNPQYLIEWDIVVVTVNYRVGALGFLTTNDENLPGNLGLKDQGFAIKWVAENIQAFGGDPKQITVGGESAGASSVSYQYLSRQNRGLLSGVIMESGTSLGMTTYQPNYREFAFALGRVLDTSFNSDDSKDLREVLLKASADDILTAQNMVPSNLTNGCMGDIVYAPIIEDEDNPNAFISGPMLNDFITGNFNRVPSLQGFNSEEGLGFIGGINDTEMARLTKLYDDDPSLLINAKIDVRAGSRREAGEQLKLLYTQSSFGEDTGAFIRYTSDVGFVRPSIRQVEEASKYVPQYMYQFSYSDTRSTIPGTENTAHGEDVAIFWGSRSGDDRNATIGLWMLKLWTNFIKYQNPTPEEDPDLGNIIWPNVTYGTNQYLNINDTLEIKSNPKNYNAIKAILDPVLTSPLILF